MLVWLKLACSRGSKFDLTASCSAESCRGYAFNADQNFDTHLCDYGELRPVPAVAVSRFGAARRPSHKQPIESARQRPPPRIRSGPGGSYASPARLKRSVGSLFVSLDNPHRSPQTAEGVQGSPGRTHGRPSGTPPCRNARNALGSFSDEPLASTKSNASATAIIAYGPQAAPLHSPNIPKLSKHLQLAVEQASPRQTTR